jgi:hypothetical protein
MPTIRIMPIDGLDVAWPIEYTAKRLAAPDRRKSRGSVVDVLKNLRAIILPSPSQTPPARRRRQP